MINSLSDLIAKLKESEPESFPKIIKQINIDSSEFEEYKYWCDDSYTRNCIERTETFELMLLCWNNKQTTPIHDHGGEKCWVYQIKGAVDELRYKENKNGELEVVEKMTLKEGSLSYMDDSMGYHALENNNDERALTLHIYMKPIDECEVFNTKEECFEAKELVYDTHEGELIEA